jgi:hypothetical protein
LHLIRMKDDMVPVSRGVGGRGVGAVLDEVPASS